VGKEVPVKIEHYLASIVELICSSPFEDDACQNNVSKLNLYRKKALSFSTAKLNLVNVVLGNSRCLMRKTCRDIK
jgi:hypothetical protein